MKNKKNQILTIPNLLSLLRLAMIPLLMWLYLEKQEYLWTAAVLILSAATDIADGIIARKFNMVSDFGKALDPIADNHITSIICVHPLLMMLLTALQQKYSISCQTAYVATDYTCCPGVKDSHPQICFVPDQSLTGEFICKNIVPDRIVPAGIPVRQQFYKSVEKNAAKRYLGIPEEKTHLLMMCGSMGCGPMEEMLELLHQESDANITVVCGTNEELQSRLAEKYAPFSHIHILGFVEDMSLLMDSADIFVTKPGGLSSTEAAIKCVPMVFVNAVGGCENDNLAFFAERGCALAGETPEETAQLCAELIHDSQKRSAMTAALQQLRIPNAGEIIFKTIHEGETT